MRSSSFPFISCGGISLKFAESFSTIPAYFPRLAKGLSATGIFIGNAAFRDCKGK